MSLAENFSDVTIEIERDALIDICCELIEKRQNWRTPAEIRKAMRHTGTSELHDVLRREIEMHQAEIDHFRSHK